VIVVVVTRIILSAMSVSPIVTIPVVIGIIGSTVMTPLVVPVFEYVSKLAIGPVPPAGYSIEVSPGSGTMLPSW
jgi:hypothetical protein